MHISNEAKYMDASVQTRHSASSIGMRIKQICMLASAHRHKYEEQRYQHMCIDRGLCASPEAYKKVIEIII